MDVLLTGSAGFIGFHVARSLLEDGCTVTGVDNFNPYYDVNLKRARNRELEKYERFTLVEADLADYDAVQELVADSVPGVVCHLAAQAGVRYSLTNPLVYEQANLRGTLNVLELCRHLSPQPRLVYASSSSVYGANRKQPFSEADAVDHPVSLYGATKRSTELMAFTYNHLFEVQTIGLRFFTVYGPWGRPDMAMWLFTRAMSQGEPIDVYNYGRMKRDFTYVDDIVAGVKASLFTEDLPGCDVYNLGNNSPENLMDLVHCIAAELDVEPRIEYKPMQPGDVESTYADIDKAARDLGFQPATPLAEGVPRFINWFKEYGYDKLS